MKWKRTVNELAAPGKTIVFFVVENCEEVKFSRQENSQNILEASVPPLLASRSVLVARLRFHYYSTRKE